MEEGIAIDGRLSFCGGVSLFLKQKSSAGKVAEIEASKSIQHTYRSKEANSIGKLDRQYIHNHMV